MKVISVGRTIVIGVAMSLAHLVGIVQAEEVVTIGLNLPLSGPRQASGLNTKSGAELLKDEINSKGGMVVGGKKYQLKFVYADNETSLEKAVSGALSLISKDKVLGIVGPNSSSRAIPVGGVAQSFKAPMVSPTSTNPKTTDKRPYVFRACFLDDFQGEVMATFAGKEFSARKAAVLFDSESAYPKGLAEAFKYSFEQTQGGGSVVAYEAFESDPSDIALNMKNIVDSDADVLFVPQYSNELPVLMTQIREAGWQKPVIGGDAWASSDLMEKCGDICKGLYFSAHFGSQGSVGKAKEFVENYKAKYGELPTNHAALGYDAANLMITAISKLDEIDGNLFVARDKLKKQLASIRGFEGVSGTFNMNADGNPAKSAVVIRINEQGQFEQYSIVDGRNG